jgi:hypothetical protein
MAMNFANEIPLSYSAGFFKAKAVPLHAMKALGGEEV